MEAHLLTKSAALLLLASLAGCATLNRPPPVAQPSLETSNAAAAELLARAERQWAQGKLEEAAHTLERALRIAPRDAAVLQARAELHLAQRHHDEAESMALKALQFSQGDAQLCERGWRTVEQARRASGRLLAASRARARREDCP